MSWMNIIGTALSQSQFRHSTEATKFGLYAITIISSLPVVGSGAF